MYERRRRRQEHRNRQAHGRGKQAGAIPQYTAPFVPNYRSFDFFDIKFDHSSYSNNLCKHSQI